MERVNAEDTHPKQKWRSACGDAMGTSARRFAGCWSVTILPSNALGVFKPPADIVRYFHQTGVQCTVGTDDIDWASGGCNPRG
jgi:hypothetical protein